MARRKQLKNIAHGLLGTFVSRYNDVDGFWGLGVLRSLAVRNGLELVALDLIANDLDPLSAEPLTSMERHYRHWLCNALDKIGVNLTSLSQAKIDVRFTTFDELPKAPADTWGEPYVCTVKLVLHDGKSAQASTIGVCAVHDDARELRSTRVG